METTSLLSILALLALAVVVVVLLLRIMRARHADADRPVRPPAGSEAHPTLTKEQQEYLDSSHILPPGHDALDARAEEWRKNQRK